MFLLVIGLVAVIIAVPVAFFLVTRRRGDDDEPGGLQSARDRLRGRAHGPRQSTDPRIARRPAGRETPPTRRPAGEPRGYGGPGRGYEPSGYDQSRGYEPSARGYGERSARGRDQQRTERIPAARGSGRYQDAPEPAPPAGGRAARAATAPRRSAVSADTGPAPALYDTGPPVSDSASTRINADPDLADSDVFPRVRADIPETEAKARPKSQSKGRGRSSRGRHDDDDDDWPSTEWDKLSDEQYWAELSSDKPLATTARSAQPNSAAPAAPAAKSAPAARAARSAGQPPAPGRGASRPQRAPANGLDNPVPRQPADRPARPSGRQGAPRRPDGVDTDPGRPGPADRPAVPAAQATEQLPVRNQRQAAGPVPPGPVPPSPAPFMPAGAQPGNRSRPARAEDDPLTSPSFARSAAAEDSRSYRTPRRSNGARPGGPGRGAAEQLPGCTGRLSRPGGRLPAQPPRLLWRLPRRRPGPRA